MSNTVRRLLLVAPFVLSIGVPYVMVSESMKPHRDTIRSWFQGGGNLTSSADASLASGESQAGSSASGVVQQPPVTDLSQILRFDISPRWVLDRWPQVTTTRAEDQLVGLRVALVTGTQPQDVAGALTYYFDKQQRLRRIALRGTTGDERYLVSLVTRYYQLKPELVPGVAVYTAKWNGQPISALVVRRKPVLHANEMLGRADVMLELNRATNYVHLSPELEKTLAGFSGTPAMSAPPAVKATANSKSKPRFQTIPGGGIGTLFSGY